MRKINIQYLAKAGVIAAIYIVLTLALQPIAFGPVQFRLSEALTILPFIEGAAIPGLFIGCFFANIFGGLGFVDIVFGSLTTLIAAYLTSKMPNKYLAILPPVILNAFIISIWVSKLSNISYIMCASSIGFGEFISAGIFGIILLTIFQSVKKKI